MTLQKTKEQFKELRVSIDNRYKNIQTLIQNHNETFREIRQEVIQLAHDMAKLCELEGRPQDKKYICAKIISDLKRRGMFESVSVHVGRYVLRWLEDLPEYKQNDIDYSSPDLNILHNKTTDSVGNVVLEECNTQYATIEEALRIIKGADDRLLTRTQLQEIQSELGDLEIQYSNTCTNKKIALITDAKRDDWQDRNKPQKDPPYHIKEECPEGKETKASQAWRHLSKVFSWYSKKTNEIADRLENFVPQDEEIEKLADAADTIGVMILGPVYNQKCKLDYYDWANVVESLEYETISHAAKLTEVDTPSGNKRGITKEAVNDFIDPEQGEIKLFKKFVDSITTLKDLHNYFADKLKPARMELTKELEKKYKKR